jgi:hypothetical protein
MLDWAHRFRLLAEDGRIYRTSERRKVLMQDQPYHPLGHLAGTEVGVQPTLSGQDILVEQSDAGQRLACLLSPVAAEMDRLGDDLYWRIPHTAEIDWLLTELIDLFISIRYSLSWPKTVVHSKIRWSTREYCHPV